MSAESLGQIALREWLEKEVKLERYFDKFVAHGFASLEACCNINDSVLDKVGITPPYHRKRLLKFSESLKDRLGAPGSNHNLVPRAITASDLQASIETGNQKLVVKTDNQGIVFENLENPEGLTSVSEQKEEFAEAEPFSTSLNPVVDECHAPPLPPKERERKTNSLSKNKPAAPARNTSLKRDGSISETITESTSISTNNQGIKQGEKSQLPNVDTTGSKTGLGDIQSNDPSDSFLPQKGKLPPPIPPRVDLLDVDKCSDSKRDDIVDQEANENPTSKSGTSSQINGNDQTLDGKPSFEEQNCEAVIQTKSLLSPQSPEKSCNNDTNMVQKPRTVPLKPPRKLKNVTSSPASHLESSEQISRSSTSVTQSLSPNYNKNPSIPAKTPIPPPRHHKKLERSTKSQPIQSASSAESDYETVTLPSFSKASGESDIVHSEPSNNFSDNFMDTDNTANLNQQTVLVQRSTPAVPARKESKTKSLERPKIYLGGQPTESVTSNTITSAKSQDVTAESSDYETVESVKPKGKEVDRSSAVQGKPSKELSLLEFLQEGASPDDTYEAVEQKEKEGSTDALDYESDDSIDGGLEELPTLRDSRAKSISVNSADKRVSMMGPKVRKSEGYLYKQGGRQNNKGWKRRWFQFDGKELRYYKEKGEHDSLHVVPVSQMKNVEYINDPKRARFNLLTSHRIFMLAAESTNEVQLWTQTLMEGIINYQKTVGNEKDPTMYKKGGLMCDPDKKGWLKKQGHNVVGDWRKRYVVIKGGKIAYFDTKEDFDFETPICVLDAKLATVKSEGSRSNRFQIVTAYKTYSFQADSESDAALWIESIREAIQIGLGNMEVAEKIWENPSNKECADCGAKDPKWASVNLLVVVCIHCAGYHRKLGVHYCKVRSLLMDETIFNPVLVKLFVMFGNEKINKLLCHKLPDDDKIHPDSPRERREEFINSKYRDKKYSHYHKFFGYADALGGALRKSVVTDDVLGTMELILNKANLRYVPEGCEDERRPLELAVDAGKEFQAELLRQNGADKEPSHTVTDEATNDDFSELPSPTPQEVYEKEGSLTRKEGVPPTWKKRYFMLKGRQLKYSRGEGDKKEAGFIDLRNVTSLVKAPGDNALALDIITTEKTHNLRMETEEETESWFTAIKNKQVFGVHLNHQERGSDGIPHIVAKCLQFVEISGGLEVEGIYRLSGSQSKIRALKQAFNQDAASVLISTEDYQVHDVTGTLKLYLRELPEPVIPAMSYSRFIEISRIQDHHVKLQSMKTAIDSLSPVNYDTLKRIIGHLDKVTKFGKRNKMELQNVSVIFGPTLMSNEQTGRMNQASINQQFAVVGDMITFYDWLFSVGDEEKRREEEMQEAIKKIKDAVQVPTQKDEWTLDIYLKEINDFPCRLKVSSEMTAGEVCMRIAYQKGLAPDGNWALFEALYNGNVERAFYAREKVLTTVMNWGKAGKNNCLIVKENYIRSNIEPFGSSITCEGTLLVRDAKRKDWRQSHVSLREGCIFVDKTKTFLKGGESEEWSLHKLSAYVGVVVERPTKGIDTRCGFTIVVKSEPEDIVRYFCGKDRSEMFRWMAAIIHMKYPEGMWIKDTALYEQCGFSAEARFNVERESQKASYPASTMHLGRQSSMLRPPGSSRHVVNELKIKQKSLKRYGAGQVPSQ